MPFDCPSWPPQWPEIETAVRSAVQSGDWGRYHSDGCAALEKRLVASIGARHVRVCCSGTAALEIALRALRIGAGDEVMLAAYDYPGNFRTIELLGGRPVLVDVASDAPSIDPCQLEQAASDQVRAVVASHLYGTPADVVTLRQCCDDHGWILIEDACQAIGMLIDARPVGSFGHFATLSFGGSKLISAGSGGALLVNSDALAAKLGALLDRPGETFPLAPLQAVVIAPQLDRLDEMNRVRNQTAKFLQQELSPLLARWRWHCGSNDNVQAAFYKVAWTAQSDEHRRRIIEISRQEGMPIGEGFRSMSRCSERRCRKPMSTARSDQLSQTLFVLDHRALLIEPSRYNELADSLRRIHDAAAVA